MGRPLGRLSDDRPARRPPPPPCPWPVMEPREDQPMADTDRHDENLPDHTKHIVVCGGRNYSDGSTVARVLSALDLSDATVRHGAASGADSLAADWCRTFGVPDQPYPADWKRLGKDAGPIRNSRMLAGADLVVAFPGGRGTEDMVRRALAMRVTVLRVAAGP